VVRWFGSDAAPAAVGVLFLIVVALFATRIVAIDRDARVPITEMAALRATSLFGALPAPALETIAREARRIVVQPGDLVLREGDAGYRYFAIVSGDFTVVRSGVERGKLGRGDGFGEIALLHDVPRTASIRATSEAVLLVIDRAPFLAAVTGHVVTGDRATSIADDRIESDKRESGRREA
jgi:CRP-like cAMP-binding protein